MPQPRLTQGRGGSVFGDFAVRVLRALVTREPARLTLNVRSDDVLPDFDPERIVEVPYDVRAGGVTPEPQPRFPRATVGLLRMLADYQAAAAIWADDPDTMAQALAANPLMLSLSLARELLRARAEAQAGLLGKP